MRRMSFAGALAAIAIGAVLAFAVHASPKDLDLQEVGVIIMLGGVADVLVRLAIPGGPLTSGPAADVAAGAEAGGEPVLDAEGNPVFSPGSGYPVNPAYPTDQPRPPLISPLPGTLPGVRRRIVVDPSPWPQEITIPDSAGYPAQASSSDYERAEGEGPVVAATNPVVTDPAQVPDTPEAPQAVRTVTGRPVRPRGRWSGGGI
jgi:hypothetical protein